MQPAWIREIPGPEQQRAIAQRLDISETAVALHYDSDVIDLHVDSFIWHRLFGYDFRRRNPPFTRGMFLSQFDLPRAREAGIRGASWIITTNPLADGRDRQQAFFDNVRQLSALLESHEAGARVVTSRHEYERARRAGLHAAFLGVQGGNALSYSLDALARPEARRILRITLLHLTSSRLGSTSAPLGGGSGLTRFGKDYVAQLNAQRILVDLAHISKRGFWDALDAHASDLPPIVTHTGLAGVHPHWRNIDDAQLRAIADRGGTTGIMYHSQFLGDALFAGKLESVVRHIAHAVNVAGEDHVSLGSDWDGSIVTPRDMPTCLELPRLTQALLSAGFCEARVRKILGQNFLRVVEAVRG
jgi:membrane dipeptidase